MTVFALFAERVLGFGPSQTANLFIVSSVVAIVVQTALIGALVDRFGEGRIALAGLACAVVAYAGVGFVTSTATLIPVVVLWSLSGALIRPALGALISQAAPADQRGTILSVNDSLNNLAFLISPFISTTVLTSTRTSPASFRPRSRASRSCWAIARSSRRARRLPAQRKPPNGGSERPRTCRPTRF